ncbi:MAG: peptidoglycan bridge formation glycyltransferase FemA/FemB family protein, partial [Candidatus Spechtbacterales bacterium]
LHCEQWKNFQERAGRTTRFFGGGAYAVQMPLPVGLHYWYSPFTTHRDELIALGKETGAVFVKCEPMSEDAALADVLTARGFIRATKALQPQRTRIVALGAEEAMLAGMHSKTRYNIRVAQKRGVTVAREESIQDFTSLMAETTQRDKFHAHPAQYYEELRKTKGVSLYVARVAGAPAAAALVLEEGTTGVYLHGASSYAFRAHMAPFALHWSVMKALAGNGMTAYDLWGIDEKKWPGVTRFKGGFGGREVEYIGSYDYVLKKMWYRAYQAKNKLR